jgi:flagellar hook-basal body complex protein FliE
MSIDTQTIDSLIGQLRTQMRAGPAAPALNGAAGAGKSAASPDFAAALKSSLEAANRGQVDATQLARQFELGSPQASLSDVMISMQKANLSFQQMVQVRNRLVSAYHDTMNMQV